MRHSVAPIMASLTLSVALAGCIPGGSRYYRPTMAGGQIVKHY
ncbi:hypothetical protein [Acidihalobacter aeolianus]|nr:hypothetical protein [Acidihalobacter aeolianus]